MAKDRGLKAQCITGAKRPDGSSVPKDEEGRLCLDESCPCPVDDEGVLYELNADGRPIIPQHIHLNQDGEPYEVNPDGDVIIPDKCPKDEDGNLYETGDDGRPIIPDHITLRDAAGNTCDVPLGGILDLGCEFLVSKGTDTNTDPAGGGEVAIPMLQGCEQTLEMFNSGWNFPVNDTGTFIATQVPIDGIAGEGASFILDGTLDDEACKAMRPAAGGGIEVLKSGVYSVDSYSQHVADDNGGVNSLIRWRHRPTVNGAVSGHLWPGASTNLEGACGCELDGGLGTSSETLCLNAGDIVGLQVATLSNDPEPITVTSAGLAMIYHGAKK